MSVGERDPYTGHLTTGHSWNSIKELNTDVPKLVYLCFAIMFIFSVGYWIYMPSWPLVNSYTQGLSKFDQRHELEKQVFDSVSKTAAWRTRFLEMPLQEIAEDDELLSVVSSAAPALFEDNCAGCHGSNGVGNANYPKLNDNVWLWSSEPVSIYQTLLFGINAKHPKTRVAQMPAFGSTDVLTSSQIQDVALYVLSLSMPTVGNGSVVSELLSVNRGGAIYGTNCSACHGSDGKGNPLLGSANLIDSEWLYGFRVGDIVNTITDGRAGHMPAWNERLNETELRLLSVYVSRLPLSTQVEFANDERL